MGTTGLVNRCYENWLSHRRAIIVGTSLTLISTIAAIVAIAFSKIAFIFSMALIPIFAAFTIYRLIANPELNLLMKIRRVFMRKPIWEKSNQERLEGYRKAKIVSQKFLSCRQVRKIEEPVAVEPSPLERLPQIYEEYAKRLNLQINDKILKGLKTIVYRISTKPIFKGTPKESKKLEEFYAIIRNRIKVIINQLEFMTDGFNKFDILEYLGEMAEECSDIWLFTTQTILLQWYERFFDQDSLSWQLLTKSAVAEYKLEHPATNAHDLALFVSQKIEQNINFFNAAREALVSDEFVPKGYHAAEDLSIPKEMREGGFDDIRVFASQHIFEEGSSRIGELGAMMLLEKLGIITI